MDYIIPYSWYYHPNFVDPLYSQYLLPREIQLNPYLLNKNEVRDGCRGIYHRKKISEASCPPGFTCFNTDYCYKNKNNFIGLYNLPFKNEYWRDNKVDINFYHNDL